MCNTVNCTPVAKYMCNTVNCTSVAKYMCNTVNCTSVAKYMCNTVNFTTRNPVHTEKLKPRIDPRYDIFPYLLSYFRVSDEVCTPFVTEITVLWNVTLCSLPVYYSLMAYFAAVICRVFE